MQLIVSTLQAIGIGVPIVCDNLTLFPLTGEAAAEPGCLTLDQAVGAGLARVTEVSEAGAVPRLRFANDASLPVLILDGEELVGAKQNRAVNVTILAAAGTVLDIPVSCVEAGRWRHESPVFDVSADLAYAGLRAQKTARVSENLRAGASRTADQAEVWAHIARKAARLQAESETGAMRAVFERHAARLDEFEAALVPRPGQLGAVLAIDGAVRGLDLFDHPAVAARLLPKVVRSYALDAIESPPRESPVAASAARSFVDAVAAAGSASFAALGLGTDVRLDAPGLAGAALVHAGRVVHLCAFRTGAGVADGGMRSRLRAASLRARGRAGP